MDFKIIPLFWYGSRYTLVIHHYLIYVTVSRIIILTILKILSFLCSLRLHDPLTKYFL